MKLTQIINMNPTPAVEGKYYLLYARRSSTDKKRQINSIPAQIKELTELAQEKSLPILKVFKEAKSARKLGRPAFRKMVALINDRADIKGVVCWAVSRLSRNPKDGGEFHQLLLDGKIKEIVTPEKVYTKEDTLLLSVLLGEATWYSQELSKNVKRGLRSKLERFQFPGLAPPGYQNNPQKDKGERDITPHPIYFSLMRKVFDYALTGNFSLRELTQKANSLGIKSSRKKPLSKSQLHRLLGNPFYTGNFLYNGSLYPGKHEPMITEDEFDLLQDILVNRSRPKTQKHEALTGIIRCGECSMMVTYEEKNKTYKNGKSQKFRYYRCSKKSKTHKCSQLWVQADELEKQAISYLKQIEISPLFAEWAGDLLRKEKANEEKVSQKSYNALRKDHEDTKEKLSNLIDLKIGSDILSDEEFTEKKNQLTIKKRNLEKRMAGLNRQFDDIGDFVVKTFDFASKARKRFKKGSLEDKKTILKAIGSDLILKDKKLKIQARKPFLLIKKALQKPEFSSSCLLGLPKPSKRDETQHKSNMNQSVSPPWSR